MRSLALRIKLLVLFLGMTMVQAQSTKNNESDCGTEAFDIKAAEIAWNYFENNYNPETGFVNGMHKYKVIRPEHIGHTIMAFMDMALNKCWQNCRAVLSARR